MKKLELVVHTRNKDNLYDNKSMFFFSSSWQQKRMTWVRENESEKDCSCSPFKAIV